MQPGKAIDDVISIRLAGLLKAAGFRKTARTFRRLRAGAIQVLNVQASQNNGPAALFTINLGVYREEIANLAPMFPVTDQPKEYQCVVRQRIGGLLETGGDIWWDAQGPDSLVNESLSAEIIEAVERYGLPWLDAHVSLDSIRDALSPIPSLTLAAAIAAAGDIQGAVVVAEELATRRPQSSTTARAWVKNLLAR